MTDKLKKIILYPIYAILAVFATRLTYDWRWSGLNIINALCGGQPYGFPFVFKSYSEPMTPSCLGYNSSELLLPPISHAIDILFWFLIFVFLEFFLKKLLAKSKE